MPADTGEWRFDSSDGRWRVRPPGRRGLVPLGASHSVSVGAGGPTVHPSIVYSTPDRSDYWHGWLRAGRFQEC